MTKEEAIDYIIPAIKNYWNDKICDNIIKALAQEEDIQRYIEVAPSVTPQPKAEVLDKVRDEIVTLTNGDIPERIWNVDVLEIIDKYRENRK